ncbi:MAG: hypothetical protein MZV64_14455 [Ignavibacteriales bacterium]|nr:hypothetical protein [Ignavibacteriales bacterium]
MPSPTRAAPSSWPSTRPWSTGPSRPPTSCSTPSWRRRTRTCPSPSRPRTWSWSTRVRSIP